MVWDQAGFHTSRELKLLENVTTVPLPAYSLELNPLENLWRYLRSHYWANRAYRDYDDLRIAAVEAWQKATLDTGIIKSVCRAKYAERKY
jgi:transposase